MGRNKLTNRRKKTNRRIQAGGGKLIDRFIKQITKQHNVDPGALAQIKAEAANTIERIKSIEIDSVNFRGLYKIIIADGQAAVSRIISFEDNVMRGGGVGYALLLLLLLLGCFVFFVIGGIASIRNVGKKNNISYTLGDITHTTSRMDGALGAHTKTQVSQEQIETLKRVNYALVHEIYEELHTISRLPDINTLKDLLDYVERKIESISKKIEKNLIKGDHSVSANFQSLADDEDTRVEHCKTILTTHIRHTRNIHKDDLDASATDHLLKILEYNDINDIVEEVDTQPKIFDTQPKIFDTQPKIFDTQPTRPRRLPPITGIIRSKSSRGAQPQPQQVTGRADLPLSLNVPEADWMGDHGSGP